MKERKHTFRAEAKMQLERGGIYSRKLVLAGGKLTLKA
jgi:hypothetical protein